MPKNYNATQPICSGQPLGNTPKRKNQPVYRVSPKRNPFKAFTVILFVLLLIVAVLGLTAYGAYKDASAEAEQWRADYEELYITCAEVYDSIGVDLYNYADVETRSSLDKLSAILQ